MTARKSACLIVSARVPASDEAEFNQWYDREHVRDRVLGVPGFQVGRRFASVDESGRYLAYYDVDDIEVFASEPFLNLVRQPDPRSRRFIPLFSGVLRTVAATVIEAGEYEGGSLLMLPLDADGLGREPEAELLDLEAIQACVECPGVVRVRVHRTDLAVLERSTRHHLRGGDTAPPWLLVVEGTSASDLDRALAAAFPRLHGDAAVRPMHYRHLMTVRSSGPTAD